MAETHMIIPGNPVTKKNSQRIVLVAGRPRVMPSKKYKEYEELCLKTILRPKTAIQNPTNIKCLYYRDSRRRVDLTNLLSATMDILVKAGVLADDNRDVAASNDGSRVYYDKENPRVEIYISALEEDYEVWSKK